LKRDGGPAGPHYFHERVVKMNEKIQAKVDSLLRYRAALDDSERELFDMLIRCANEVAMAVDGGGLGFSASAA